MQLECPHCHAVLEFAEQRPSFCGYCGQSLSTSPAAPRAGADTADPPRGPNSSPTVECDPVAATVAPPPEAAAVPVPPPDAEIIGGYRLLRPLGSGGMGTVYEAEEISSGRHVALKLISAAAGQDAVERFRREGRLASAIHPPRCVFVLAADEDAGRPYIVMELMPGQTLHDLVKEGGPLPPAEAVAKVLDVIAGLQEAHRLGVIHRDVKPSNCFLEADGRVKVGDFGLAKSLVGETHLTKTGSFLGTALFASPEQVRADPVDQQSDVYSVAATLYYLLTGRAPHQTGDAAATLARIASDPASPLRSLRPDLPPALDKAVLRGLARDRKRRWRDLAALRTALEPFLPQNTLQPGRPGARLAAYLIDCGVFLPLWIMAAILLPEPDFVSGLLGPLWRIWAFQWALYFLLLEGVRGCSLGKWWMGLRVYPSSRWWLGLRAGRPNAGRRPGWLRAALRTLFFCGLVNVPWVLGTYGLGQVSGVPDFWEPLAGLTLYVLGVGLVAAPMRQRNGYRGLHEWISGTRVVELPRPRPPWTWRSRRPDRLSQNLTQPPGLPERVGPFVVRGALRWSAEDKVLLGEDPTLGRKVCLQLRPLAEAPVQLARRDVSRPTRLRWLGSGQHGEQRWDAFVCPAGCPLADLVAGATPLSWAEARPVLEQLADELTAACADGTLPKTLTAGQVWVQPDGRVQMLGTLLEEPAQNTPPAAEGPDQARALALLCRVAVLALEARVRPTEQPPTPLRAPLPWHAVPLLDRMLGVAEPYETVAQLRAELAATRDRPPEIRRSLRARHLTVQSILLCFGLVPMFVFPFLYRTQAALTVAYDIWAAASARQLLNDDDARQALFAQVLGERPYELKAPILVDGRQTRTVSHEQLVALYADGSLQARLADNLQHSRAEFRARHATRTRLDQPLHFLSPAEQRWLDEVAERDWDQPSGVKELQVSVLMSAAFGDGPAESLLLPASLKTLPKTTYMALDTLTGVLLPPLVWVVWAFLFRGGLTWSLLGITLVGPDGRRAARWRCAGRAALVWAPLVILLSASLGLQGAYPNLGALALGLEGLAASLLVVYPALALWSPARGPRDWLAGTYLVPS